MRSAYIIKRKVKKDVNSTKVKPKFNIDTATSQ